MTNRVIGNLTLISSYLGTSFLLIWAGVEINWLTQIIGLAILLVIANIFLIKD